MDWYPQYLEAVLQDESELDETSLDTAESSIGYVVRNSRNDWFNKKCQKENGAQTAILQHGMREKHKTIQAYQAKQ